MIRLTALAASAFLASALLAAAPAQAAFTLDFSGVPSGQTPFSVTATDGNVLTFTAPSDPGAFTVSSALPFTGLGGGLTSVANTGPASLTISFARAVSNLAFTFEFKNNTGTNLLTTRAFNGATPVLVGTAALTGFDGQFPIGSSQNAASGQTYTSITLSGTVPFGIARLVNTDASTPVPVPGPVGVPEPMTLAVLGTGLLGLVAARRRG